MTANYVLLERITVGEAGAASVTFNNIPQSGYTDLKIVCSGRTVDTGSQANMLLTFNGITTAYYDKALAGNGSSASSFGDSNNSSMAAAYVNTSGTTANTFGNYEVYIPNYTSSNYKSFSVDSVVENNATSAVAATLTAGLWQNTAAITSVSFAGGYNFKQYSTFSLYGLAAVGTTPVIAPYASGGDIIETDGTYWYHAFLSSGTFTPAKGLSCDVLVVAGGGAGGGNQGGGGGAGGLLQQTGKLLTSGTGYTCTIGAGGAVNGTTTGNNGNSSAFDTISAIGGGGGGTSVAGVAGGSGGGGGYNGRAGGSATQGNSGGATGYGNAGSAHDSTNNLAGAGGGAGTAGNTSLNSTTSGAGGAGLNTWSAWASATGTGVSGYYAGGGGGGNYAPQGRYAGAGGAGGGGAGADTNPSTGTAGKPNTGSGGGGGAGANNAAGAGGSGIVIVRYAI